MTERKMKYPSSGEFATLFNGRCRNKKYRIAVKLAYEYSKSAFKGIKRDSGKRYFEHTKAVAWYIMNHIHIRNEKRLTVLVISALLHDLLEDTYVANEDTLKFMFDQVSPEITQIISELTKDPEAKFDKLVLSRNINTKIVKGSDRLNNTVTILVWKRDRVIKKIRETEEIIIPWMRSGSYSPHVWKLVQTIEREIDKVKAHFHF